MPVAKVVRVGIIGAGFSGLSAARYLLTQKELGDTNVEVTVIEGRDRVGGRAHTDSSCGVPVDFGASWIHGIEDNPIYKLVQDYNVPVNGDDIVRAFYNSETGARIDQVHVDKAPKFFGSQTDDFAIPLESTFFTYLNNYRPELRDPADPNAPVPEAATNQATAQKETQETKENKEGEENNTTPPAPVIPPEVEIRERIIFHYLLLEQLVTAGRLGEISVMGWSKYKEYSGDQAMFKNGYKSLVDALAYSIFGSSYECPPVQSTPLAKTGKLMLSSPVTSINYESPDKITVTTKQGNTYDFDHVIVTLPLGVLKNKKVQFSPPLLKFKQDAIASLGLGVLDKVLKFKNRFWPTTGIACLPTTEFGNEFLSFVSLHELVGEPVLVAFVCGQFAKILERMDKTKIQPLVMKRLRELFPENVEEPIYCEVTKWNEDEFSLGSYSFPSVRGVVRDIVNLTEPIQTRFGVPRVMFAGEATHEVYYGTTHAAFISGEREGKRLIDCLTPKNE